MKINDTPHKSSDLRVFEIGSTTWLLFNKERRRQIYNWFDFCYLFVCFLFVLVFVCLFVSNKRQNGWTDRAQILCRTSRDPREGLWMIKIKKSCVLKFFIFVQILKSWKSANFLFLFFNVYNENMFTIEIEDGREAP